MPKRRRGPPARTPRESTFHGKVYVHGGKNDQQANGLSMPADPALRNLPSLRTVDHEHRAGHSGEQRAAEVVAAVHDAGQSQEVAAAERADVVDERLVDQPRLHGLELALDVLLETGKDQADVQVADLVESAVIVPRSPQDPAARGLRGPRVRH